LPVSRRLFFRIGGLWRPVGGALLALASTRCGLLGAPGGYSGGGEEPADASADGSILGDGPPKPDAVVLPDGNVASSIGTLAILAGARDPTSPEDDPAWSADAWSGILDANGRVATWRIEKSAPLVGLFDSAGLIGNKWVMVNIGFGLDGARGTAIQQTSWGPGIVGDWRVDRATGAPRGLDETTRAFFGANIVYVGGSRKVSDDGGATTSLTKELHMAAVDTTTNTLGPSTEVGVELVVARARAGVAFGAANVYVVGGRVDGGLTASVEMAKVDVVGGTIEAFAEQPPMKVAGEEHKLVVPGVVVEGGYLWVAGGRIDGANAGTDVVLSSKIDATTGVLAEFQSVTKLPKPLRDHAFVAFKGRLYVAGGIGATSRSDDVYSAAIGVNGTLGAWEADAKLPGARSDFVALAY
jgi:hypothetical protein